MENKKTPTEPKSSEQSAPPAAWEEDTWRKLEFSSDSGSSARKGTLVCTSRCGRCQLPNVCPETAEPDKVVPFKVISKYRRVDPAVSIGASAIRFSDGRLGRKLKVGRSASHSKNIPLSLVSTPCPAIGLIA
jgi:hypothetical protein